MNKIKTWISNYYRKNSWYKITGDVIFYIFIILMIIPTTRREISSFFIRATLRKPPVEEEAVIKTLDSSDYQLVMEDMEGYSVNLKEFEDEIILLNFWATWCPPCRAEMPSMQELYNDYGDRIRFVLVSSEDKSKIKEYFDEFGYDMPVYIQRSALPPAFPVRSIPTTYLINRQGEVIVEKTGAANWNSDKFRSQLDRLIGS